jgi:hypothetical protein
MTKTVAGRTRSEKVYLKDILLEDGSIAQDDYDAFVNCFALQNIDITI